MKVLHIFDFDDTLVSSDSSVIVTSSEGKVQRLSSEQYAKYSIKPGDVQDFSEFDTYPKNPEIIEPVFSELRAAIALDGPESVVILTARSNSNPVRMFLEIHGIDGVHIEAVGSSDPMSKAKYILFRLKQDDKISAVRVFEDNVRNIRTIKKIIGSSGVLLKTNRVSNGRLINQERSLKNESKNKRRNF